MDTPEEARDYDSMDHSQVNRVFIADFLAIWNGQSPILDLGTGTALIPIEFCRQSPKGVILAIDAAAHMLTLAEANVRQSGFESRISCRLVDAKRMGFADGTFSAVMSNSIVPESSNRAQPFLFATCCGRTTRQRFETWSKLMPRVRTITRRRCLPSRFMPLYPWTK